MLQYYGTLNGEMSERFKELVLKTSDSKEPRVRIPFSPPFFINFIFLKFKLQFGVVLWVGDGQQIRARPVDEEARICWRCGQNL